MYACRVHRAALTGKHDTLVRRPPAGKGPYASILPVYQQTDWGPGMVKCVGPTRCLMRPCVCISSDLRVRPTSMCHAQSVKLPIS